MNKTLRETKRYYGLIIRCALRATLDFFDLRKPQTWLKLAVTIVGFVLLAQAFGIDPAVSELFKWIIAVVVPSAVLFVVVFVVQFVYTPARIHQESALANQNLEQQNIELREKLKPKLAFEFRSEPPFEQINILFDDAGKPTTGQQRLYRIGVRCLSPATPVDNVSVELVRIEPSIIPFLPVPLHLMHDNPPSGQPYKQIFDLGPDETKFVDVLYIVEGNTSVSYYNQFAISYALQGTPNLIPARRYRFTVAARSKNYPATYRDLVIQEDPQRGFRFALEQKSP